jgi:hypothetical protein
MVEARAPGGFDDVETVASYEEYQAIVRGYAKLAGFAGGNELHSNGGRSTMITCVVDYEIDPREIEAFERFAKRWMELVQQNGGVHHGYFLPSEGSSDRALALFSFPSLAAYEDYRRKFGSDPDFIEADRIRDESNCVRRYDRSFMRPLLP